MTSARSLVAGLRFVLEPISVAKLPTSMLGPDTDSAMLVNAFVESKRRYAAGARSLGVDERFPESETNNLGYAALQYLKKPALAIWLFRENVDAYPQSANVYDSLGDALLVTGDSTAAISQFRRAVDLANRTKQGVLAESQRKL